MNVSYQNFAYVYDYLMKDAPYQEWVEFLKKIARKYQLDEKSILDIGCGTGELAIRLKEAGFQPTGVDLSEEMLAVAIQKASENQHDIPFYHQDMRALEGLNLYDIVVIFCDSLNYLGDENDVKDTFKGVLNHMKEDGLFIFDVHSVKKMSTFFSDQTYADNGDDISYIWNAWKGTDIPHSVVHELTFYVYDHELDAYNRFDEDHFQRTYPIDMYKTWLDEIGFELVELMGDFGGNSLDEADRIFFVCKRK
ncbi:class I SAM-dependent methyltransferase [Bacillus sp. D386]|uniref:class I SAM-dependent DNA methyltransferase n=1 Tax=Bacillus sp. D386 TaxID=2587155 RepID=UPI00111C95FB|nr:class I SAM-dependent methyltransferase [Bacillus sp. D386]